MGPDDISSCPSTYLLSEIDPQSTLSHPQASHGEQFLKLDLQIRRNGSQPACLPKSHQHLQMVSTDYCFPICLGWLSPPKEANNRPEVDDQEEFSKHLLCSYGPLWFSRLQEPLAHVLFSSYTSLSR